MEMTPKRMTIEDLASIVMRGFQAMDVRFESIENRLDAIEQAKVERGKIIFTPKSLVDRGIAQSLEDFTHGRAYGPFKNHQEFLKALHSAAKKVRAAKRKPK